MQGTKKSEREKELSGLVRTKTVDPFLLVHNVFTFITERFWTLRTGIC